MANRQNNLLRKIKESEASLREKIRIEKVDKAASKEKQAALIFRFIEEKKKFDRQLAKVYFIKLINKRIENGRKNVYWKA